ncbi:exonuclease domain-containing protein [Candidatus Phytoplasma prunorum]|uniref:exonuclease domain-containing protein n=1 Tax=Candidatus Phytoplasma prunorum TaxID=47565 RepID=UPI002FEFB855
MSSNKIQQFLNYSIEKYSASDFNKINVKKICIFEKLKKIQIQLFITQKIDNFDALRKCLNELTEFIQKENNNHITDLKINYYFIFNKNYVNDHEYKYILKLFKKDIKDYQNFKYINKLEKYKDHVILKDDFFEISVESCDFRVLINSEEYNNLEKFFKDNCNLKLKLKDEPNIIIKNIDDIKLLDDLNKLPFEKQNLQKFKDNYKKNILKIKGYILFPESRICKNGSYQFSFFLCQVDNSIKILSYTKNKEKVEKLEKELKKDKEIEIIFSLDSTNMIYKEKKLFNLTFRDGEIKYNLLPTIPFYLIRKDNYSGKKRIEFHLHTKMSNLDAVTSAKDYLEKADEWGHKAIAFTDHNGVYAYPEIAKYSEDKQIKPIYGVELEFIEEKPIFITNQNYHSELKDFVLKEMEYVVFDIETTGFSKVRDKIIEISGFKIKNNIIIDQFSSLVNPETDLPENIYILTKINNETLKNAPKISQVLPNFLKFIENTCLVAHNASFDVGFIFEKSKQLNILFPLIPVIDTLSLSQYYFSSFMKFFSLKRLASKFKIKLEENHRAENDAKATVEIFIKILDLLENEYKVFTFYDLGNKLSSEYERTYDINVLVSNQIGYRNLFKVLSDALTNNFYKKPRVLKTVLAQYREGLLIGSGCYNGNVFEIALNDDLESLKKAISFYDYIEVQPPQSYSHLIYELGNEGRKIIEQTILKIIQESKNQKKIIIASGDVHYLYPHEKIYREIYINAKLIGGGLHKLSKYEISQLPDNAFLTTQEMLDSFNFLSSEIAEEIVITNTHKLNQKIEKIKIFPNKLFSLSDNIFKENLNISSIKSEIKSIVNSKLTELYGKKPHFLIKDRIKKEFKIINGDEKDQNSLSFAPIYYLSHLLAKKSLLDGYLVGSRGSIGSSLVAKLLDITEVNPLKPHYICPKCFFYTDIKIISQELKSKIDYFDQILTQQKQEPLKNDKNDAQHEIEILKQELIKIKKVYSGYDLPNKDCPNCGKKLKKDGNDIPFETFLGFKGNKIPDIDLNFAGDYQFKAHSYIKELLGEYNVFKAGTIQTVAERNAYGYIKGFLKDKNKFLNESEISRRTKVIQGVKRSTGQHPGGIVIVPKECSIYDITPIQYPANDKNSEWKTTHFDYHSFENNLLKLDILGHDDPIMIKFLMDYVKTNSEEFDFNKAQDIPLYDELVYKIFSDDNEIKGYTTLGIPEFGTVFVRKMLKDIVNKNSKKSILKFSDLVKISGLSHGTGVWTNNAEKLIDHSTENYREFNEIIACRDDIMTQLIEKKIEPLKSFEIMEFIRKGLPFKNKEKWSEYKEIMKENQVEDWYIESAEKIEYLFPKAHAVAYVIMAIRIAWFKFHKPLLFYSGYFSKRADHFDYDTMTSDKYNAIENKINSLNNNLKNTAKETNLLSILKVAKEFRNRKEKFQFLPIDLNKSEKNNFILVKNKGLLMPFITLDGLGPVAASRIIKERKIKDFTKKDFLKRSKVNKTIFSKIESMGLLNSLPDE